MKFVELYSRGRVSKGLTDVVTTNFLKIQELTTKYIDLPMDFADACLVFLGNKLKINTVATIDRDFDIYRFKGKRPFTVLIK